MNTMRETAEWVNGRLVHPRAPGICIHLVGVTPGFWCSGCNDERAALITGDCPEHGKFVVSCAACHEAKP